MEPGTSDITQNKVQRKTFLKGAAAAAATLASSGVAATVAHAKPRVEAPYFKAPPSGEVLIWIGSVFTPAQVAAFNKVYPNVKVTQRVTPYIVTSPSLTAQLVSGVAVPDGIVGLEDSYLGQYADALYDVGPWIEPLAAKIAPFKLAASTQGGRIIGIPWDVDPAFLIYRKDILEQAGVDPAKIVTYDDLLAAAKQIKAKVPSCTAPLTFNQVPAHLVFTLEGMAWQQHSGMIDAKGKLQLKGQAYTNAWNYLEAVGKSGTATVLPFATPQLYNAWIKGTTAITDFADWWTHWNSPGLQPIWSKIGLAKQPVFNTSDSHYSMMGGSAYIVPQKAKRPDLGALFLTFQAFDTRALKASNVGDIYAGILPAAEALWSDINPKRPILASNMNEHSLLVQAAEGAPTTYRYAPWYARTLPYIAPKIVAVLNGTMSAAAAQAGAASDVQSKVVDRYR